MAKTTSQTVFLNCPAAQARAALERVIQPSDDNTGVPILGHVAISLRAGVTSLVCSDLSIEISHSSALGGAGSDASTTAHAQRLLDILRSLPPEQIVLVQADGRRNLAVSSGKSRFLLRAMASADFPRASFDDKKAVRLALRQADLKRVLSQVCHAAAVKELRAALKCVLLDVREEQLHAVATNGHRLALASTPAPGTPGVRALFSRRSVAVLKALFCTNAKDSDVVECEITPNQARLSFDGTILTTTLVNDDFPAYSAVVPQSFAKTVTLSRQALRAVLRGADIISDEAHPGVTLTLTPGMLSLSLQTGDEDLQSSLEVDYEGEDFSTQMQIRYVLDALDALDGEQIDWCFNAPYAPSLIRKHQDTSLIYLLSPMRS
jgi:DNA polymerase-3 subunit beta